MQDWASSYHFIRTVLLFMLLSLELCIR